MAEDQDKDSPALKNSETSTEDNHHEDNAPEAIDKNAETQDGDDSEISASDEDANIEDHRMEEESDAKEAEEKISEEMQAVEDFDLNLLLDIPLEITVELGRSKIQIQELLDLGPGSTVTLSKLEGEPVDVLANDKLIARGEVVLQNKKYGIRITEITSRMTRIKNLN